MKKIVMILAALLISATALMAQKFAYVDTEYILNKIPAYKSAQTQITKLEEQYRKEIEDVYKKTDELYKKYQADKALLTNDMKQRREEEIINKEKEAKNLQAKYFGPEDGTLFKKREELIKPIQDQVYNAIKDIATERDYATVFDAASNAGMIYNNPRYDISDKVLEKMGHKN